MNELTKEVVFEKVARKEITAEEALILLDRTTLEIVSGNSSSEFIFDSNESFIKDHIVMTQRVLMGVTHCSLAIDVAIQKKNNIKISSINNISFIEAIKLKANETIKVDVLIETKQNKIVFINKFKTENGPESMPTASGEIVVEEKFTKKTINIAEHKKIIKKEIYKKEIYKKITAESYYGSSLHTLKKLWVDDNYCLAELELSEELQKADRQYYFHPALFDGAFVGSLYLSSILDNYVPLYIKKISIGGPSINRCYCLIEKKKINDEIIVVDMKFCNLVGEVFCLVEGFASKRVGSMESFGVKSEVSSNSHKNNSNSNSKITEPTKKRTPEIVNKNSQEILSSKIEDYIIGLIRTVINDFEKEINIKKNFLELGVASNDLIELSKKIEADICVELYPTLFFENQNIEELTAYFKTECKESFLDYFKINNVDFGEEVDSEPIETVETGIVPILSEPEVIEESMREPEIVSDIQRKSNSTSDIAIIGMAGRFAKSSTLGEFWENIKASKDLVTEIPTDHWDYNPWFSANKEAENKTYSKWGSFISDVDKFDPLFFNISPAEATWTDPQLRHLLEVVYETVEDAGYSNKFKGTNTGVFIGSCFHEYWDEIVRRQIPLTNYESSSSAMSALSGRVSYTFDLIGASIPLDNACASSLTALHLACQSIKLGECSMAVVGGLNLLLSPLHYVYFSRMGALSPTGRCHTFDKKADGYVPGEGIVSVLVKPLNKAIKDRDNIHAIIKGSAINHVGHASNPTAPRPEAQTKVIIQAWKNAEIDPQEISYIEAHGTGTELGDPIEVNALKKAFKKHTNKKHFCAIGSTKAHIGHLEGAAGLTSVIKVVLQMKHKTIPVMPNFSKLNPFINLSDSPFFIKTELQNWEVAEMIPLRAGVSSFGMTGNNAHIVLEEYPSESFTQASLGPCVIVLSAKNEDRLNEYSVKLRDYILKQLEIEKEPAHFSRLTSPVLADIAYTFQVGREPMEERLSVVVNTIDELLEKIGKYIKDKEVGGIFRGNAKKNKEKYNPIYELHHLNLTKELTEKGLNQEDSNIKLKALGELWCKGFEIDWTLLYEHMTEDKKPRRISLPTYPFEKKKYWIKTQNSDTRSEQYLDYVETNTKISPLIDSNIPVLPSEGLIFQKELKKKDLIIADYIVNQKGIYPSVCHIEMVYESMGAINTKKCIEISEIVWIQPLIVIKDRQEIQIVFKEEENYLRYEICERNNDLITTYSMGIVYLKNGEMDTNQYINIEEIKEKCGRQIDKKIIYDRYQGMGIEYGEYFQGLERIYISEKEVLGKLILPDKYVSEISKYILHPTIMDGALQTVIGFYLKNGSNEQTLLPFSVEKIEMIADIKPEMYSYVKKMSANKYDVILANETGQICVKMLGFEIKQMVKNVTLLADNVVEKKEPDFIYHPNWEESPIKVAEKEREKGKEKKIVLIIYSGKTLGLEKPIIEANDGNEIIEIKINKDIILDQIIAVHRGIDVIYFLGGIHPPERGNDELEALENSQEQGVLSLFRLVKTLITSGYSQKQIQLKVVTNDVHQITQEDVVVPYSGSLFGFVKTLAKEYPQWEINCVDISLKGIRNNTNKETKKRLIAPLIIEPANEQGNEVIIREGKRYIQKIYPLVLKENFTEQYKQQGVYLLLGGAGGIGFELSKYLIERVQAKIILVGRSNLTIEKEKKIKELSELGGEIVYLEADICNYERMKEVIRIVKEKHGKINGIFHLAIVLNDKTIANMDEETFKAAMAPKVTGSVVLDKVLMGEELDFVMFFSSAQSFAGNVGQSNYAAACTFKDAYAKYMHQNRSYEVKTINWGYWGSVGIVATEEYRKILAKQGIISIDPEAGMKVTQQILVNDIQQIIPIKAEKNILEKMGVDFEKEVHIYSSELESCIEKVVKKIDLPKMSKTEVETSNNSFKELDEFSIKMLLHFFQKNGLITTKGEEYTRDQLRETLKIIPKYERLFSELLNVLDVDGYTELKGPDKIVVTDKIDNDELPKFTLEIDTQREALIQKYSEIAAHVNLVVACVNSFSKVLSGEIEYAEIMFPEGSMKLVEGIYKGNKLTDYYNIAVAKLIKKYIEERIINDNNAVIRIMEIGSGTGGTSKFVLKEIREYAKNIKYYYTDVSIGFTKHGKKEYGSKYDFIDFQVLDVEKDPIKQNIEGSFIDIIFGTNVFHATKKIDNTLMQVKKILKKNGLLIINEITQKQLFTTLTFGLTDGWWAYEDEETRINGTPLLNVSEWEVLLKSTGYSNQQILSSNNIEIDNSIQNVIIGESNGQVIISKSRINHLKKEIKRSITNNNVSVVHSDNHSKKDIKNIIIKVLSNSLQIDSTEFELHTPYVDFGVDSILAVEIIKRLNKELDIQLKPTDLFSFPTINQLTNHLESNNDRIRLPNKKTGTPIVEIREELTDNKSRKDMHEIDDLSEIDLDKVFQSLKNGTINVEEASLIMENLSNE